jgi:hypothetical protein
MSARNELTKARTQLHERAAGVDRIAVFLGVDVDGDHLGRGDQEARDDAGEEQPADRDGHQPAPDDHQDRGRDDDAHDAEQAVIATAKLV